MPDPRNFLDFYPTYPTYPTSLFKNSLKYYKTVENMSFRRLKSFNSLNRDASTNRCPLRKIVPHLLPHLYPTSANIAVLHIVAKF